MTVDFGVLRLEPLDYCGCGRLNVQLVDDAVELAYYRKIAGLPELEE